MKKYDKIIGGIFASATLIIIFYFFTNREFFEWSFARHHNVMSWYVRPLFIIPIVIGAYKKSLGIIFASIFALFTSMFWFPEPSVTDPQVIEFLNFEKNYLMGGWTMDKVFVAAAVILFFIFLIYTTWTRKWKLLAVVIIVSAVLKVLHSIIFSGDSGLSIIKPAIAGVILCLLAIGIFLRKKD